MELRFYCAAWPDSTAVKNRLSGIDGLGAVQMDQGGRSLSVNSFSAESAQEASIRLKELGWRPML